MSEPNPEVDALAHMMGNLNRPVVVSFQPRQSIHRPCLMLVTGPWYNYVPILSREPDEKTLMFVLTDRVLSPVEVLARVIGGDHVRLSSAGRLAIDSPHNPRNPSLKVFIDWGDADQWFMTIQAATGGRAILDQA